MRLLVIAIFSFCSTFLIADSPITSTGFGEAYADVPMVKKAIDSDGELTDEYCNFIFDKKNDFGARIAVVSALGWKFDGKTNFDFALEYLIRMKKVKKSNYLKKLSGEDLICLAYLKALDNYFKVDEALQIAEAGKKKAKSSYTAHIIHALIAAQANFDKNWCDCWKFCDNVRQSKSLNEDLNSKAQKIIFDYMDLYKEYCK